MRFAKQTLDLVEKYEGLGYEIHVGNNPRMDLTKKWADHDLVRIARTNSRYHGNCVRTVWATKKL
jgi:hypothetical protein